MPSTLRRLRDRRVHGRHVGEPPRLANLAADRHRLHARGGGAASVVTERPAIPSGGRPDVTGHPATGRPSDPSRAECPVLSAIVVPGRRRRRIGIDRRRISRRCTGRHGWSRRWRRSAGKNPMHLSRNDRIVDRRDERQHDERDEHQQMSDERTEQRPARSRTSRPRIERSGEHLPRHGKAFLPACSFTSTPRRPGGSREHCY